MTRKKPANRAHFALHNNNARNNNNNTNTNNYKEIAECLKPVLNLLQDEKFDPETINVEEFRVKAQALVKLHEENKTLNQHPYTQLKNQCESEINTWFGTFLNRDYQHEDELDLVTELKSKYKLLKRFLQIVADKELLSSITTEKFDFANHIRKKWKDRIQHHLLGAKLLAQTLGLIINERENPEFCKLDVAWTKELMTIYHESEVYFSWFEPVYLRELRNYTQSNIFGFYSTRTWWENDVGPVAAYLQTIRNLYDLEVVQRAQYLDVATVKEVKKRLFYDLFQIPEAKEFVLYNPQDGIYHCFVQFKKMNVKSLEAVFIPLAYLFGVDDALEKVLGFSFILVEAIHYHLQNPKENTNKAAASNLLESSATSSTSSAPLESLFRPIAQKISEMNQLKETYSAFVQRFFPSAKELVSVVAKGFSNTTVVLAPLLKEFHESLVQLYIRQHQAHEKVDIESLLRPINEFFKAAVMHQQPEQQESFFETYFVFLKERMERSFSVMDLSIECIIMQEWNGFISPEVMIAGQTRSKYYSHHQFLITRLLQDAKFSKHLNLAVKASKEEGGEAVHASPVAQSDLNKLNVQLYSMDTCKGLNLRPRPSSSRGNTLQYPGEIGKEIAEYEEQVNSYTKKHQLSNSSVQILHHASSAIVQMNGFDKTYSLILNNGYQLSILLCFNDDLDAEGRVLTIHDILEETKMGRATLESALLPLLNLRILNRYEFNEEEGETKATSISTSNMVKLAVTDILELNHNFTSDSSLVYVPSDLNEHMPYIVKCTEQSINKSKPLISKYISTYMDTFVLELVRASIIKFMKQEKTISKKELIDLLVNHSDKILTPFCQRVIFDGLTFEESSPLNVKASLEDLFANLLCTLIKDGLLASKAPTASEDDDFIAEDDEEELPRKKKGKSVAITSEMIVYVP